MLFHISGPANSGKTTLGKKLSQLENTIIIDMDEIDDANGVKILSDNNNDHFYSNNETIGGFFKLLEKKNIETLEELLQSNSNKNIIIIGTTLYPPPETNVQGYSIEISPEQIFHQANKRSLDNILKYSDELSKVLNEEKNILKADLVMLFEYKLRWPFPLIPVQIEGDIQRRKKFDQENGYKYAKPEDIVSSITSQIKNSKMSRNKSKKSKSKSKK